MRKYKVKNFYSKKPCIYKDNPLYYDGYIECLKKELFHYNIISPKNELEESWIDIIIDDTEDF